MILFLFTEKKETFIYFITWWRHWLRGSSWRSTSLRVRITTGRELNTPTYTDTPTYIYDHIRYLRQVGTSKASEKRNPVLIEKFEEVEKAFSLFGFSSTVSTECKELNNVRLYLLWLQEFDNICQVLAAVLSIGDIKIEEDLSNYHLGEVSMIANPRHVQVGEYTFVTYMYLASGALNNKKLVRLTDFLWLWTPVTIYVHVRGISQDSVVVTYVIWVYKLYDYIHHHSGRSARCQW